MIGRVELITWQWYGYVEGVGGAVKLSFVLAGIIFMIVDATRGQSLRLQVKMSANSLNSW
jgi:hypothetical protein